MSDDIWRPGGSIDRDGEGGDEQTEVGSSWSAVGGNDTTPAESNPFGDSGGNTGGKHRLLCFLFKVRCSNRLLRLTLAIS